MKYNTVIIQIPEYNPENGFKMEWEKDFLIEVMQEGNQILLKANENGLRSLAKLFLSLADKAIPTHYHIHLDDSNSLEEGSCGLIIEKV